MSTEHDDRARGPHVPVLLDGVLQALDAKPGMTIIDGTFGAGGYTRALLLRGADVIAFDRDPTAIEAGAALVDEYQGRLTLIEAPFSTMQAALAERDLGPVDGVVLDIGVSSMQLDRAERGFSFRFEGPLDMRMAAVGMTAADIVNTASFSELAELFHVYGEERFAGPIARAILRRRDDRPFETTLDLATLIANSVPRRGKEVIHPATRVFQALRIAVNDELGELGRALCAAESLLKPDGILAVVTFHSLEDRIVKRFIANRSETRSSGSRHMPEVPPPPATFAVDQRKPVLPSDQETKVNPRARSAKLRAARRTEAAARGIDLVGLGLPELASDLAQGV